MDLNATTVLPWHGTMPMQRKGYHFLIGSKSLLMATVASVQRKHFFLFSDRWSTDWQPRVHCLSLVQAFLRLTCWCVTSARVHTGTATTLITFTPAPTNYGFCVLQSSTSLHMTSSAETNYNEQELRAVGWPPSSVSGWKEQNSVPPAIPHVAGTGQLFLNGCGNSEKNQGSHPKFKAPPQVFVGKINEAYVLTVLLF